MRKSFLNAHPLCSLCTQMGRDTAANTVDHVLPHHGNPVIFWDENNLQSLCTKCHNSVKKNEEIHGIAPGCDVNGFPIDSKHPWGT